MANAQDGFNEHIGINLIQLCEKIDKVRDFVGWPFIVHNTFRPFMYNELVLGARGSAHMKGMAMDFHAHGIDCDELRALLLPKLEDWNMRMEDLPGAAWCHMDISPVINMRFFKP